MLFTPHQLHAPPPADLHYHHRSLNQSSHARSHTQPHTTLAHNLGHLEPGDETRTPSYHDAIKSPEVKAADVDTAPALLPTVAEAAPPKPAESTATAAEEVGRCTTPPLACVHQCRMCAPVSHVCTSVACVHQCRMCAPASHVCTSVACVHQCRMCAPVSHVCTSVTCLHQCRIEIIMRFSLASDQVCTM
jgi:hypothetical protein